ncbi:MAG: MerR family transcriptional regulator [Xanthobacteraceae bacterium]
MEKAPDAFRTISEVADEIDVPQHVLRFWESRFPQIRPMKRGGGRRYYRPNDVDLLRGVRHLLYGEGYTIRGVQRILRENGVTFVQTVWTASADLPPDVDDDDEEVDEEIGEEEDAKEPTATRSEPNLFAIGTPRAQETHATPRVEPRVMALAATRRAPTIVPPISLDAPSPPVQPSATPPSAAGQSEPSANEESAPTVHTAEDRQKLKAALDELVACRQIIETALAQN